jgi:phosphoribosylamine-glycine ligase
MKSVIVPESIEVVEVKRRTGDTGAQAIFELMEMK